MIQGFIEWIDLCFIIWKNADGKYYIDHDINNNNDRYIQKLNIRYSSIMIKGRKFLINQLKWYENIWNITIISATQWTTTQLIDS